METDPPTDEADKRKGFRILWISLFAAGLFPLVVPILGGFLYLGWCMVEYRWTFRESRPFDPHVWRTETDPPPDVRNTPRLQMVDELLASERLLGSTRSEVRALLGEAEVRGDFSSWQRSWVRYYLGPERSLMSIDSEWLTIGFDEEGRVEAARLTTD